MLHGVIVKGIGGFYYVRSDAGDLYELRAKGRFRKERKTPLIGDSVLFEPGKDEEDGWIEQIQPRESELIRPAVANIRHIILVVAVQPEIDPMLIDTLLIMAKRQHIQPAIVVNKCDLPGSDALYSTLANDYAKADCPVYRTSALTGEGTSSLEALLTDGLCCVAGQSGVGKSTLLSRITGITLETGAISRKINRGRHTTRHCELLTHGKYQVLDTPGFSLLDLGYLPRDTEPITLKEEYPEFAPYDAHCRFQPCYHLSEPGCAVLNAAKNGEISQNRLDRYHQLLKKAQEEWKKRYD